MCNKLVLACTVYMCKHKLYWKNELRVSGTHHCRYANCGIRTAKVPLWWGTWRPGEAAHVWAGRTYDKSLNLLLNLAVKMKLLWKICY